MCGDGITKYRCTEAPACKQLPTEGGELLLLWSQGVWAPLAAADSTPTICSGTFSGPGSSQWIIPDVRGEIYKEHLAFKQASLQHMFPNEGPLGWDLLWCSVGFSEPQIWNEPTSEDPEANQNGIIELLGCCLPTAFHNGQWTARFCSPSLPNPMASWTLRCPFGVSSGSVCPLYSGWQHGFHIWVLEPNASETRDAAHCQLEPEVHTPGHSWRRSCDSKYSRCQFEGCGRFELDVPLGKRLHQIYFLLDLALLRPSGQKERIYDDLEICVDQAHQESTGVILWALARYKHGGGWWTQERNAPRWRVSGSSFCVEGGPRVDVRALQARKHQFEPALLHVPLHKSRHRRWAVPLDGREPGKRAASLRYFRNPYGGPLTHGVRKPPSNKKEIPKIPKTPIIPKSKRSFPKSRCSFPKSRRSFPKSRRSFPKSRRSVFLGNFRRISSFWNFLLGGHGHRGFENI